MNVNVYFVFEFCKMKETQYLKDGHRMINKFQLYI